METERQIGWKTWREKREACQGRKLKGTDRYKERHGEIGEKGKREIQIERDRETGRHGEGRRGTRTWTTLCGY